MLRVKRATVYQYYVCLSVNPIYFIVYFSNSYRTGV